MACPSVLNISARQSTAPSAGELQSTVSGVCDPGLVRVHAGLTEASYSQRLCSSPGSIQLHICSAEHYVRANRNSFPAANRQSPPRLPRKFQLAFFVVRRAGVTDLAYVC
jgi:hypothetical protein